MHGEINLLSFMQAPSLLITLINMFLAFGSAPSVNATATGVELEKNLYSVFAPSPEAANFQVSV